MRHREWPDKRAFVYVKGKLDKGEYINRSAMLEDPEGRMVYSLSHGSRFGSWRNFLEAFIKFYRLDLDVSEIEREANRRGADKRTVWSKKKIELLRKNNQRLNEKKDVHIRNGKKQKRNSRESVIASSKKTKS